MNCERDRNQWMSEDEDDKKKKICTLREIKRFDNSFYECSYVGEEK